ncbi:hypothetical protein GQX73_g4117 [Xylaria multiplex]|uniref:BTB domain-containing protein n=1 Tax=Xylaria multiplex TaxID=323545 RepID=A0A7C8MZJ4_9PEZI|nr:hypothetical protein GQX73_g4117 [Xylaria multiplex]
MASYLCAQGFNISNQQDIDASTSDILSCGDDWVKPDSTFINSQSPTTNLVFPQGARTNTITISNIEPGRTINASGVEAVVAIFLAQFYHGTLVLPDKLPTDTIETVVWENDRREVTTEYKPVNVLGNTIATWKQTNASSILNNFEFIDTLYMENADVTLPTCKGISILKVVGEAGLTVPVLNSVIDATFIGQIWPPTLSGLRVRNNLIIQQNGGVMTSTFFNNPPLVDDDYSWNIVSVGNDLAISAISNVPITMPNLTSITNQLSINNSIDSTFEFNQLTTVGSILMKDNADSPLPGDFRNLEFANSIHLKGHIDTSSSGNLFPSLKLVHNSVTIEAWNAEFNCSKLVSQQRQGIIGHLYCNGTDNGNTTTTLMTPSPSGTSGTVGGLSRGAWAGIGISIAVVVLGLIGLVTWAILHFRSRIQSLEERGRDVAYPTTLETKYKNLDEGSAQRGVSLPVEMNTHPEPRELDAPRPAQVILAGAQAEVTPEEPLSESIVEAQLEPVAEGLLGPEIHLQVSSAHLRLASSYFKKAFCGPFKESHRASNGFRYVDAEGWDTEALLIVMRIIHGQNRLVPKNLSLEMLAKVGVIVDYYQCREILEPFVDMWRPGMKNHPLSLSLDRNLIMVLFVSWVFHWKDKFRSVTKLMQDHCSGRIHTLGLPIPESIVSDLDNWRQERIGQITDALNDLLQYFGKEPAECRFHPNSAFECSSMLLGALTRELRNNKQLSFTKLAGQSYTGYSVVSAMAATRSIRSPRWLQENSYRGSGRHECDLNKIVGEKMVPVRKAEGLRLSEFVQIA